jgi:hypothetical protein
MISRAALSTIVQGQPKYRSMLAGNAGYVPPSFESIATVTLSSPTGWVNFSSIPSTYKSLQMRITGRSSQSGGPNVSDVSMVCNDDVTNSYSWHYLRGTGNTTLASNGSTTNRANIGFVPYGPDTQLFGGVVIDIHDYAVTTKYKTIRAISGFGGNNDNAGNILIASGLWQKTAAITTLSFSNNNNANDWASGSVFSLYGIKG